jgi:nitrogen fixation protein FixH
MTIRFNWGTGIAVAYSAFALATAGFVAFAMTQPVELVSADYYAQSLQHDQRMEAAANAQALGAAFAVRPQPGAGVVHVQWPADLARGLQGQATFYRASHASSDRVVALAPDASGAQALAIHDLAPGHWQLHLQWTAAGRPYYATTAVVVP